MDTRITTGITTRMMTGIGIAIVFVITLVFTYEWSRVQAYRRCMNGLWVAPADFCKQAGIKAACIYLGDSAAYVYMEGDTGVIIGQKCECSITSKMSSLGHQTVEYDVSISDADPLPPNFTARYDPSSGMLGFYSGDELHMQLYRMAQ